MLRKYWLIYLLVAAFCCNLINADNILAAESDMDAISARAYILIDADSGKVLKAKNAHLRLPPASMTKLMTLLLALEDIDHGQAHKTDQVLASEYASSMDGTRIYLEPGESMSLEDMLKSMSVASANDASVAVAEYLDGSEEEFVARMNKKARDLGMKDSCFKNVNGLPAEGHYSSAYDMALLARYTLAHTPITEYSSLKQHTLRQGEFTVYNSNKLLWRYEGADGLKTGYTSEALNCLTATAQRGNLRLIAVVMGCPRGGHTHDAMSLLDYGFNNYSSHKIMDPGTVCGTVKVKGGTAKEVQAVVPNEVDAIYAKNQGIYFCRRQNLPESVKAPVTCGQKVGEISILYKGKLLKNVDLLAATDVPRLSLTGRIARIPWVLKVFILLIVLLLGYRRYNLKKLHKNNTVYVKRKSP